MLKTIAGHTSAKGIFRYLTKKNRALASDYLNLDAPETGRAFDWAAAMDETRRAFGNDKPWRGKKVRTYKHYVVSPDPKDRIRLDALRDLAMAWAREHFGDYEVAIVYHDDNEHGIPHAHVVVNNTNLETGRRLQDPDPKALAASLQKMAAERGLSPLFPLKVQGVAARAERRNPRGAPATYKNEYVRRAEKELQKRGEYSWTADIRSRVRIARSVCRSEGEFRNLLGTMGVTVSDNSPKAPRKDWIYAFADHPSRRISGERLGLSYSRERLEPLLRSGGMGRLDDSSERAIVNIARRAVEVGSLEELALLSKTVALIDATRATCLDDLEVLKEKKGSPKAREGAALASYARAAHLLPEHRADVQQRRPASTMSRNSDRKRRIVGKGVARETAAHEGEPQRRPVRNKSEERDR